MFNISKAFVVRVAEQSAVAFVVAFGGVVTAGESLSKSALVGAVSAGLRAVYGVFVKDVGQVDSPSAAK